MAAITAAVGADEGRAELRPEGKAELVRSLRSRLGPVAMVGDGINDAPALAAADVGIAIGSGSAAAMETADITLVRGDVDGVADAMALSRATLRTIRQNLGGPSATTWSWSRWPCSTSSRRSSPRRPWPSARSPSSPTRSG